MKNFGIIAITAIVMGLIFMSVDQTPKQVKFGHLNTVELLEAMPQVKQARAKLEAQRKQAVKQLEAKYTKMQTIYAQAMQDAQAGKMTPVQQKQKEQELTTMQEDYAKSEKKMHGDLVKKEEALFKPIQSKIRTAIDQIAVEKGYRFIFDSSAGNLLYTRDADNVMKYAKPKLGLK
jgi:outer membrane protein